MMPVRVLIVKAHLPTCQDWDVMPAKRDGIRFGRRTDFLTRTIEALLFDRMLLSQLNFCGHDIENSQRQ